MNEKFTLTGRIVMHTESPRFTVTMAKAQDGGWVGTNIKFLEDSGLDAKKIAALMRSAGEFYAAEMRVDWVQRKVAARARAFDMSASDISKATGNAVPEDHVFAYLSGEKSMGSHKLQHILSVLRLDITPKFYE